MTDCKPLSKRWVRRRPDYHSPLATAPCGVILWTKRATRRRGERVDTTFLPQSNHEYTLLAHPCERATPGWARRSLNTSGNREFPVSTWPSGQHRLRKEEPHRERRRLPTGGRPPRSGEEGLAEPVAGSADTGRAAPQAAADVRDVLVEQIGLAQAGLQSLELGLRVALEGDEEQAGGELAGRRILAVGVVVAA